MSRIRFALERARVESDTRSRPRSRPAPLPAWDAPTRTPRPGKEAYGKMAQSFQRLSATERPGLILVASAASGDGASTVARELAEAFAELGGNTLLVDGNLRTPTQHEAFDLARIGGLTELVAEQLDVESALRTFAHDGMHVLTAGRATRAPARTLSFANLPRILEVFRRRFDWTIVDAPPITVYPDAVALAAMVDGVVLVLRAENTRWEVAQRAQSLLAEADARVLGAVLNRRKYHIPSAIYKTL